MIALSYLLFVIHIHIARDVNVFLFSFFSSDGARVFDGSQASQPRVECQSDLPI